MNRRFLSFSLKKAFVLVCAVSLLSGAGHAATSTFEAALGAAGAAAPAGDLLSVNLGETARISFSTPFSSVADEVVRLSFASPGIQYSFRAGQTIAGVSTVVFSQTGLDSSSSPVNFFSLFFQGCSVGCDFLEVEVTGVNFGSAPLVISSVGFTSGFGSGPTSFVSSIAPVTGTAPEPHMWILMIIGFAGVALQLKQVRRSRNIMQPGVMTIMQPVPVSG